MREWDLFGATVIPAKMLHPKGKDEEVWLAVQDRQISVLANPGFAKLVTIPFSRLQHFGSSAGDFRLLFTDPEKPDAERKQTLLFSVPQVCREGALPVISAPLPDTALIASRNPRSPSSLQATSTTLFVPRASHARPRSLTSSCGTSRRT
jgi:hypothetical protein